MPISTLLVDGKEYLYFYYNDPMTNQKKRIYCGRKKDPEAVQKAEQFQSRYERAQEQKDRFAGVIGRLSALSGEIAGYSAEEREFIVTCLVQAYPDLSWVESDQIALFGKVNGNKSLESRLTPIYGDLKAGLTPRPRRHGRAEDAHRIHRLGLVLSRPIQERPTRGTRSQSGTHPGSIT